MNIKTQANIQVERPFKLNRLLETGNDPTTREFTNLFNFHFTLNLSLCAQSQKVLTLHRFKLKTQYNFSYNVTITRAYEF